MGFFNTLWNVVSKPIEIAGNAVGSAIGMKSLGSDIVSGFSQDRAENLQQDAINKQLDASKYAADQSYQGALATNNANIQIANQNNQTLLQNQREINAANLNLAHLQNQWNLEQWNRQNEYNSPANQMKLYRDAGLNPVLAQGSFSAAQPLQSAELANQGAVQNLQQPNLINPAGESSQIRLQGALNASKLKADIAKNMADISLKRAQAANTYFQTHRGELILGKELDNITLQNEKLRGDITRLSQLLPHERAQLVLNNQKIQEQSSFIRQQFKTEKERTEYQRKLNLAQEINNNILYSTQDDLKKIPKAQLRLYLSQAFAAAARGDIDKFTADFMKVHGHTVPNDAFMMLVSLATEDDELMSSLRQMVKNGGKITQAGVEQIEKMSDNMTNIINGPAGFLGKKLLENLDPFGIFSLLNE